jgi:hypothetical protein
VSANNSEQTSIGVNVSSDTDELVVDFAMMIKLEMEPAAGQTERILFADYDTLGFVVLGMSDRPGASSVTMEWETDETFGDNMIIAVPLTLAP